MCSPMPLSCYVPRSSFRSLVWRRFSCCGGASGFPASQVSVRRTQGVRRTEYDGVKKRPIPTQRRNTWVTYIQPDAHGEGEREREKVQGRSLVARSQTSVNTRTLNH
uniref:Uncharacterized protein n=1 Tax=Leishmania guyanensis TaxID=5670 RepID=A0A1E1IRH1_LEIGU|nr:Hypothetical protein BN36_1213000 [Leishmania guyanensis]